MLREVFATAACLFLAGALGACNPSSRAVMAGGGHASGAMQAAPDGVTAGTGVDNRMSVKVMVRGYCMAGSPGDPDAPGGFGPSDNKAHRVASGCTGKGLYLLAQPEVVTDWGKQKGMRLVLVNQTREVMAFEASDSRLSIVQEAKDGSGARKPVEYLPESWCGNSYHRVFLEPHYYWQFAAPRYKGSVTTRLRFSLTLKDGSRVYSNEFEGSVNPEQFTVQEGHQATDIMDPYRN